MVGFCSELCSVVGLPMKEVLNDYKVVYISSGAVMVTNFIKVLSYSTESIALKVKNNVLNIEGVGIEIKELSKSEIVAKGKINRIYLSREFLNEEKKQTDK